MNQRVFFHAPLKKYSDSAQAVSNLPFVSSMLMTVPMSRVLEICVNLFFAIDSVVVELRGGTAGRTFGDGVAVLGPEVSGGPVTAPDECGQRGWPVTSVKLWCCSTASACVVGDGDSRRRTRNLMIDECSALLNCCWALKYTDSSQTWRRPQSRKYRTYRKFLETWTCSCYPRDAVLAMAQCRLSVTSRSLSKRLTKSNSFWHTG